MYLFNLDHEGNKRLHRNVPAKPREFLNAIRDSRTDLMVGAECMFTWYWLADPHLDEKIEFLLGHALYMKAIHGGKEVGVARSLNAKGHIGVRPRSRTIFRQPKAPAMLPVASPLV
jgi:hypothetical protein